MGYIALLAGFSVYFNSTICQQLTLCSLDDCIVGEFNLVGELYVFCDFNIVNRRVLHIVDSMILECIACVLHGTCFSYMFSVTSLV